MTSTKMLTFKVHRKTLELLPPSKPTPYEIRFLSDIDNQEGLRLQVPNIYFYKNKPSIKAKDPITVIRAAIARALVFYYPMAGRLREYADRKLAVECTGEGVVFVEADADVTLEQFGNALYPPFPYLEKLLLHIPIYDGIINTPLLIIQVTRLKCGGFIFAYRFNHSMCDGGGAQQFMSAVGELAHGAAAPSNLPVWQRYLLTSRHPPHVSFTHREYDVVSTQGPPTPHEKMVHRSIFFGADDIAALRRSLSPRLKSCSKFEVVAACIWRCRAIALSPKPDEETRFICVMDMRKRMNPPLSRGYYGNAVIFPTAVTTAEKLSENPLDYAVELVRKAKNEGKDEYVRSVADLMAMRNRHGLTAASAYMVSDLTHVGFNQLDLGWGAPVYGGLAKGFGWLPTPISWYIPLKNEKGEEGILVPDSLPPNAVKEFRRQLRMMIMAARATSEIHVSKL